MLNDLITKKYIEGKDVFISNKVAIIEGNDSNSYSRKILIRVADFTNEKISSVMKVVESIVYPTIFGIDLFNNNISKNIIKILNEILVTGECYLDYQMEEVFVEVDINNNIKSFYLSEDDLIDIKKINIIKCLNIDDMKVLEEDLINQNIDQFIDNLLLSYAREKLVISS